jgi:hypothetical protein
MGLFSCRSLERLIIRERQGIYALLALLQFLRTVLNLRHEYGASMFKGTMSQDYLNSGFFVNHLLPWALDYLLSR